MRHGGNSAAKGCGQGQCCDPIPQHLCASLAPPAVARSTTAPSPCLLNSHRGLVDTLLHYNLRYCLDTTAEDAEEEARLQAEAAAAAADGGDVAAAAAAAQRVRGAPSEPPLRFRPAVHRTCIFPVSQAGCGGFSASFQAAHMC